ncbi:uncharacterized protein LOC135959746 [Calliphora vicina]|uniref:uncharacterized protein LOC135959746 n=1 Tax=Calliphora vicina TaxID=7373 RepID=UPI00325BCEEF
MEHAKFWQEFFQLYKELPALWRVKSTEYSDRALKSNCYLQLIRKLREVYPDADREMVVRKINNFRTSYRKELRRLKDSQEVGRVYKPTLWYFDCLSFLDDQDESVAGRLVYEEDSIEEKKHTTNQTIISSPTKHQQLPTKRYIEHKHSDEEVNLPTTSKRRKKIVLRKTQQPIKLTYEEQKQAQIDADILAKSWAVQYKEMQGNQKLIARKIISDILFHGCMGTLNMSHTIDIQDILLRNSNTATQSNLQSQSPRDSNSSFRYAEQEYFNFETVRESSIAYNSSSPSMSPTRNAASEIPVHDIKFEVP